MRRTWVIGIAAAVALAVPLAGCSDGDGGSSSPTTEAGTARTTSNDPYCQRLHAFNERFDNTNPSNLADPAALRLAFQDAAAAAKDAEVNAPEAVKADLAVLNTGLQELLALLEQVNFDITRMQLDQVQRLQKPELEAASVRVAEYTREHCE